MSVDEADRNARHAARMQRKKAVVDEKMAQATQDKGLILILTGNGKGKSSSGFGMVARALGHGMRVGIVQFIKGATRATTRSPQVPSAKALTAPARRRSSAVSRKSNTTSWAKASPGKPRTANATSRPRAPPGKRRSACCATRPSSLVLLDELNIVLKYGYLSLTEVIEALQNKPPMQHVVVTGRGAKARVDRDRRHGERDHGYQTRLPRRHPRAEGYRALA